MTLNRALWSGDDRAHTGHSGRAEKRLSWRDGIGGNPNRSEMGSNLLLIMKQRGWIEKLTFWELGGRMKKNKKKGPLGVRWEERSSREGKRGSEKTQPEEEKEEREQSAREWFGRSCGTRPLRKIFPRASPETK